MHHSENHDHQQDGKKGSCGAWLWPFSLVLIGAILLSLVLRSCNLKAGDGMLALTAHKTECSSHCECKEKCSEKECEGKCEEKHGEKAHGEEKTEEAHGKTQDTHHEEAHEEKAAH